MFLAAPGKEGARGVTERRSRQAQARGAATTRGGGGAAGAVAAAAAAREPNSSELPLREALWVTRAARSVGATLRRLGDRRAETLSLGGATRRPRP